jgi:hypothetical protein
MKARHAPSKARRNTQPWASIGRQAHYDSHIRLGVAHDLAERYRFDRFGEE